MDAAPKKKRATRVAKPHTPGWQTTEFWVTQLTVVAVVASALDGVLPPKYAAAAVVVSQGAFAIARGIAKMKREGQAVETTEVQTETK